LLGRVLHLTILAPGLLGGSVAQAAFARGVAQPIAIWARRPEVRLQLAQVPWCSSVHAEATAACAGADLVVICAPVASIPEIARTVRPALKPGAVVTDVGSVKGDLCRQVAAVLGNTAVFVGAHPMAGSEKTGHENASADLFVGRPCFVTPLPEAPPAAVDRVVRFWADLGADVTTEHPDRHDEIVAHISHLPHVVAAALCGHLANRDPAWRNFAGPGLRDTTRIAAGDPRLWREILESNRHEVLTALRGLQDEIEAYHAALANGHSFELLALLERGKAYRDRFRPAP
jgi:cyclohexadieny/prephenate dehydrogenase